MAHITKNDIDQAFANELGALDSNRGYTKKEKLRIRESLVRVRLDIDRLLKTHK